MSNCIRFLRKNYSSKRVNSVENYRGKKEGLKQLNVCRITDRNYILERKEELRKDRKKGSVTEKATSGCRQMD